MITNEKIKSYLKKYIRYKHRMGEHPQPRHGYRGAVPKDISSGAHAIATRISNAESGFYDNVQEQFGFSREQAAKILRVFIKEKVAKLDVSVGRYKLTHGAFWDKQVMENALGVADDKKYSG
jgi:hypothetical protein